MVYYTKHRHWRKREICGEFRSGHVTKSRRWTGGQKRLVAGRDEVEKKNNLVSFLYLHYTGPVETSSDILPLLYKIYLMF
jgi:hypothetical protein